MIADGKEAAGNWFSRRLFFDNLMVGVRPQAGRYSDAGQAGYVGACKRKGHALEWLRLRVDG